MDVDPFDSRAFICIIILLLCRMMMFFPFNKECISMLMLLGMLAERKIGGPGNQGNHQLSKIG